MILCFKEMMPLWFSVLIQCFVAHFISIFNIVLDQRTVMLVCTLGDFENSKGGK